MAGQLVACVRERAYQSPRGDASTGIERCVKDPISPVASLVGDPARANMLTALMGGGALTASELALEAGVTLQTASSHLAKLTEGGLLELAAQGRHRYSALAGPDVAAMLESITGVAEAVGPRRVRPGPRDKAMRDARVCHDHMAGNLAVDMFDSLVASRVLVRDGDTLRLGARANMFFAERGIALAGLAALRRPLCRACLDWSVRRSHLAGALGAAIFDKVLSERWARREAGGRALTFSPKGRQAFVSTFLAEEASRPVSGPVRGDIARVDKKKGAKHCCPRPSRFADEAYYSAACRLILLSAMSVSFLSVAFSSARFCSSSAAQSLRPSSVAHAISVP